MKFKVKKVLRKIKRFPFWRKEWTWTLYAKNGKVIGTSGRESYQNRQECLDIINQIKGCAIRAEVWIVDGKKETIHISQV
ncbi:MAG: YegP family protein [Parcubacteria group bacterium]|jgi:uncharacterized protein YegP (UPF0339 family)